MLTKCKCTSTVWPASGPSCTLTVSDVAVNSFFTASPTFLTTLNRSAVSSGVRSDKVLAILSGETSMSDGNGQESTPSHSIPTRLDKNMQVKLM